METVHAEPDASHAHALASIIRGMVVALGGSVLGGGLAFVFSVVLAHGLSQTGFGLLVLALNLLMSVSALSIAGADYAAIRYVAAALTPGRKRGAMRTPILVATVLNVALALVTFALARPIAVHLLGQPAFVNPLRALALVLPLTVLAQMLAAAISGLEQARGEFVRKVAEQGGRILAALCAVAFGLSVTDVVFGLAAAAALAVGVVGTVLLRVLPRGGRTEPLAVREALSFVWPQTVANAASQLWWLLVVGLLARYGGARDVALFGAAAAIARMPALVYNSFAYRFSPTISRLWEAGQLDELGRLLKGVTRWVAMLAVPLYAVAIALPGPLLRIFGDHYRAGALTLSLIAIGMLIDSVAGPLDRALIMTGRVRSEMAANMVTSVLLTAVAVPLVVLYGLDGAAVSLIVYNVVLNGAKALLVWRSLRMNLLTASLVRPLLAGLAAAGVVAVVARSTSLGDSLLGTAALALLLVALYAAVMLKAGISRVDRDAIAFAFRSRG